MKMTQSSMNYISFLLWVLAYPLTLLSISRYRRAVYVMTIKLFADMERKRRELEQRDMEERKRKRETEIEAEEKAKVDKEWQKNFEESRQGRVSSWQKFQHKKTKTSKGFFKPPKNKMEQRWNVGFSRTFQKKNCLIRTTEDKNKLIWLTLHWKKSSQKRSIKCKMTSKIYQ